MAANATASMFDLKPGLAVFTSDGEHLGWAKEIGDGWFKVDVPWRRDYWLPMDQVLSTMPGERVTMRFEHDYLDRHRESAEPIGGAERFSPGWRRSAASRRELESTGAGAGPYATGWQGNKESWAWTRDHRGKAAWSGDYDRPTADATRAVDWRSPGPYRGVGPVGYRRSDERICEEVCERLTYDGQLDPSMVSVEVRDGDVLLAGWVNDRAQKYLAEDISEEVAGVRSVKNEMRVGSGG